MNSFLRYTLTTLIGFAFISYTYAQDQVKETNYASSSFSFKEADLAIKSNFLYDACAFVNLGVELGINDHFSLSAEAICPWFESNDKAKATKLLSGGLEGRYYWRGKGADNLGLCGPYFGLHLNGGICDIARNGKGAQTDYFVMGGPTIGYSAVLADNWRLNFAFGIGYLRAPYTHYHVLDAGENLYMHYNGVYSYVGPTKVEISMVWLLSKCWKKK